MPKGKCIKCGSLYYGWALVVKKEDNICPMCGGKVEVQADPPVKSNIQKSK